MAKKSFSETKKALLKKEAALKLELISDSKQLEKRVNSALKITAGVTLGLLTSYGIYKLFKSNDEVQDKQTKKESEMLSALKKTVVHQFIQKAIPWSLRFIKK